RRERAFAGEPAPERLALDVRHDVIEEPTGFTRVVQWQDVRVSELGRDLYLAQEARAADRFRQLRPQHLNRDLAMVLEVLGQVDRSHAPLAQHALDVVPVCQRGGQADEPFTVELRRAHVPGSCASRAIRPRTSFTPGWSTASAFFHSSTNRW